MPSIDKPADCAPVDCSVAAEPEPRSETAEESVDLPLPASDAPRAPSTDEPPTTTSDLQKPAESEEAVGAPPPLLPVIQIDDLDWPALGHLIKAGGIRARIQNTVCEMDTLLSRPGGPKMLFDGCRSSPTDRAILVADVGEAPLWIVGDLHGDLLALEAALTLVRTHPQYGSEHARLIFLGDLFDDEGFGLEVLLRIFELVVADPAKICIVAGNHDEALAHDGVWFTSTVSPSDFSEFLNRNRGDDWITQAGKLAIQLFNNAPRALFFPDGLLVSHGGFPLTDLHANLQITGDWNSSSCLSDFVWARAHPTARKKLPNRFTRGSQFGHEDFAAFCSLASSLGRSVTHMVRGHDHVEERFMFYPAYHAHPILTTVALSRRLSREFVGTYERVPTIALYAKNAVPQVFRLNIPSELVREIYPEPIETAVDGSQ
jgi:hypothetical protein